MLRVHQDRALFMFYRSNKEAIGFQQRLSWQARQLRRQPTPAEEKLWTYLRRNRMLGYKFRRQFVVHNFIADFYCHQFKLIIEVDGEVHQQQIEKDQNRDLLLKELGYTVVRFTNENVLHNTKSVLSHIASLLKGGGAECSRGGEGKTGL